MKTDNHFKWLKGTFLVHKTNSMVKILVDDILE